MNVEAVLASERQSELSETAVPEQIQPLIDRRKAKLFDNNEDDIMDFPANGIKDLEWYSLSLAAFKFLFEFIKDWILIGAL